MMTKDFHTNKFEGIQVLRAFAALFVIFEHIRFLNCGAFGVDIFFCISGFMIMFTTHNSTEYFLTKRLIRILPFYYLMTLGTYTILVIYPTLFEMTSPNIIYLIKSILFIPFEISPGIIQPILRIGWTINYEIFFYIVFYISIKINHKYRGLLCSCFLFFFVIFCNILKLENPFFLFYGNNIQFEFILGILSYYIIKKLYDLFQKKKLPLSISFISILMTILIFILLAITKKHVNFIGIERILFWGIPSCFLVILSIIININYNMNKLLVQIGDISFSIYFIHYYPILFVDRIVYSFSTFTFSGLIAVGLSIFLILILSYFTYQLIEKKLSLYLKQFFY